MTTTTTTSLPTTLNALAPAPHELERQLRTLSLSGMAQTLLARNQEVTVRVTLWSLSSRAE